MFKDVYQLHDNYKKQNILKEFFKILFFISISLFSNFLIYSIDHFDILTAFLFTPVGAAFALVPTVFLFQFYDLLIDRKLLTKRIIFSDISIILIMTTIIILISYIITKFSYPFLYFFYLTNSLYVSIPIFYFLKLFKKFKKIKSNIKKLNLSEEEIGMLLKKIDNVHHFSYFDQTDIFLKINFPKPFFLFIDSNRIDYLTYEINDYLEDIITYDKLITIYQNVILINVKRYKREKYNTRREYKYSDLKCFLEIYSLNTKYCRTVTLNYLEYLGCKLYIEKDFSEDYFNKYEFSKIDRSIYYYFRKNNFTESTFEQTENNVNRFLESKYYGILDNLSKHNGLINYIKLKCIIYNINTHGKTYQDMFCDYVNRLEKLNIIDYNSSSRIINYSLPIFETYFNYLDLKRKVSDSGYSYFELRQMEDKFFRHSLISLIKYLDSLDSIAEKMYEEKKNTKPLILK